jgi:linoleoyl-CoA desaturase
MSRSSVSSGKECFDAPRHRRPDREIALGDSPGVTVSRGSIGERSSVARTRSVKFGPASSSSFGVDVERAVLDWFRARGISPKANRVMVLKTAVIVGWVAAAYTLILAAGVPWSVRWCGCLLLGLGLAGLGMAVGHDALHGAYSDRASVNRLLGLAFDVMGANGYIWKFTHNIVHHTYTNIDGVDMDIDFAPTVRMSPSTQWRPRHRYQFLYAFGLYALAGIHWVLAKDFIYFARRRLGPYHTLRHRWTAWAGLVGGRLLVLVYSVVVPLWVLRPTWWQFLIGWFTVYTAAGLVLALTFQLAHAVTQVEMPAPHRSGRLDFALHQIDTTADFACGNRLLSWYVGGLNFQVEHHLFPAVCSTHYPHLRAVVREVAARHGVRCHEFPTLRSALASHVRHLWLLGRPPSSVESPCARRPRGATTHHFCAASVRR